MLINSIKKHSPESCLIRLKLSDFCPTHWVEKVTGLNDFEDLFAPIVICLEEMSLTMGHVYNKDTSTKNISFYKLMTSFDFLSSLVITTSALPVTHLLAGPSNRYCWRDTSYWNIEKSYLLQTQYCWYLS